MAGSKFDSSQLSEAELATDAVFRALGEYHRRTMLVLIAQQPGLALSDISEQFAISRFAVMKHLNILEAAQLIRRETDGKSKRHYFIYEPIEQQVMPWLAQLREKT